MPPELQTRLLRVLADNEFYSVGAHTPTIANVRIIAATHQNLEALVEQGIFRRFVSSPQCDTHPYPSAQ